MKKSIGLFIKVTHACNLKCTYCYDHRTIREKNSMKIETFKSIIDMFAKDYQHINIMFHGGEPLAIGLDWYKQAIAHCKSKDTSFSYSMQSNGLLLNEDIMAFLKENKIGYGISYDGLSTENYRLVKKEAILEKIDLLKKETGNAGLAIVCNDVFLENIIEEYEHIKQHATSARFNHLFGSIEKEYYEKYIEAMKKLYVHWLYDENPLRVNEMLAFTDLTVGAINKDNVCMNCHTGWIGIDYDGLLGICDFGVVPREVNMGYYNYYLSAHDIVFSDFKLKYIKRVTDRMQECIDRGCVLAGKCSDGCNAKRFYHPSEFEHDGFCMIYQSMYAFCKEVLHDANLSRVNKYVKNILGGRHANTNH